MELSNCDETKEVKELIQGVFGQRRDQNSGHLVQFSHKYLLPWVACWLLFLWPFYSVMPPACLLWGFDLRKLPFFPRGSIFLVPVLLTYAQRTSSVSSFIKRRCCATYSKLSWCYLPLINYTWKTHLNPKHPSLCISCSYVHHAVFYLFLLHLVLKDGMRNNAVMSLSDAVIKARVQLF